MFEDLIKNTRKIHGIKKDPKVPLEFLEDIQDILWDLATEPCKFCGQNTGQSHKNDCKYVLVMEELEYQILKYRRM